MVAVEVEARAGLTLFIGQGLDLGVTTVVVDGHVQIVVTGALQRIARRALLRATVDAPSSPVVRSSRLSRDAA